MPLPTKTKEIGGLTFEVTGLAYLDAQDLLMQLLRLAGPGLVGLIQLASKEGGTAALSALANSDVADIIPILSKFFEKLEPAVVRDLTHQILETTRVRIKGKLVALNPVINLVICDLWTGLTLQAFALSVHIGNFSSARDALSALGLRTATGSDSPESTTSAAGKDEISSAAAG
jgi:hypothetical protein